MAQSATKTSQPSSPESFNQLKDRLSTLSREELIATLQAQQELERRMKEAPLLFYWALLKNHKKQQQFFQAIQSHRRVGFFGGNRSGKTTAGSHQAIANVVGYRYWEVPNLELTEDGLLPPREHVPTKHWVRRIDGVPIRVPNTGVIITGSSRLKGIGQTIWPYIWSQLPIECKKKTTVHKGAQGVPETVEFWNGSQIIFASEDQDDMTLESFIADWAWGDEPISKNKYNAIWARLVDFVGMFFFTLTPLKSKVAWMRKMFIKDRDPRVAYIQVKQEDNPFMTPEKIKSFEEEGQYDEAEKAARRFGEFQVAGRTIFTNFDEKIHVIDPIVPHKGWVHGITVDPHHKRPAYCVVWAYNTESEQYIFYREWPIGDFFSMRSGGLDPQGYSVLFRELEASLGRQFQVQRCDPRFGKAEFVIKGQKFTAWRDEMNTLGWHFDANIPNTSDIEYRHTLINRLLHYDKNFPIEGTNQPKILITTECPNLIESMQSYGYRDDTDVELGVFKKVSEEFKDPADAVAYTVLKEPVAIANWMPINSASEEDIRRDSEDDYY